MVCVCIALYLFPTDPKALFTILTFTPRRSEPGFEPTIRISDFCFPVKRLDCFLFSTSCIQVGESLGPVRSLAEGKPGELFVGTTRNAIIRAAFPDTLTPIVQVEAPGNVSVCSVGVTVLGVFKAMLYLLYRVTQMSCGVWMSTPPWSSLLPAHRTNRFISGIPTPTSPSGARPSR